MKTELLANENSQAADGPVEVLAPHWVGGDRQADFVVGCGDRKAVWVVAKHRLASRIVRRATWPRTKAGFLVLLDSPRPELLPALMKLFERVAFCGKPTSFLPKGELMDALGSPDRRDRFIGGIVDQDSQTVSLWRGDLTSLVVPFSVFAPTANGTRPNFERFAVTDYGHTLRFGGYEAAADAVLYENDTEFRRRLNRKRVAEEQTLGASIRRLRTQRQMTRHDFPGLEPKTLARIERGEVKKPQRGTLTLIAERLGVDPDELRNY